MADVVAPEFTRFVTAERRAGRLPAADKASDAGAASKSVLVQADKLSALLIVAAKRASGLVHPTQHAEVVWVDGDRALAINLADLGVKVADGLIRVTIPVRCDQTGRGVVEVVFAVGSTAEPRGLYASTYRRPDGPPLVVAVWSEALVAFAWQCVLGLVSGIAGAIGKDQRGNVLVPVDLSASKRGLEIVPMARHRFAGSSGLQTAAKARDGQ